MHFHLATDNQVIYSIKMYLLRIFSFVAPFAISSSNHSEILSFVYEFYAPNKQLN